MPLTSYNITSVTSYNVTKLTLTSTLSSSSTLFAVNLTYSNLSVAQQQNTNPQMEHVYTVYRFILSLIGIIGMLGNAANIAVFSLRYRKRQLLLAERSAMLGFVGLAVSDFCFCLAIVPHYWHYAPTSVFTARSFRLYYQLYHPYFIDVFVKTSCWLATIISVSRYMTLYHSARAAFFTRPRHLKASKCIMRALLFLIML